MSQRILQGYIDACHDEEKFDENGIAYRLNYFTIGGIKIQVRSANSNSFSLRNGDYLIVEFDPSTGVASRALKTFSLSGTGKKWKSLKSMVADEKYFYGYMSGIVKHKELKSQADDLSKEGYTGSQSFKIVLETGDYFMVSSREGKRIKSGDKVEKLITDQYGFGPIRNVTNGYKTKEPLISTLFVILLILASFMAAIYLATAFSPLDGGKIALIVIIAFIPISLSGLLYGEFVRRPKLLRILESYSK